MVKKLYDRNSFQILWNSNKMSVVFRKQSQRERLFQREWVVVQVLEIIKSFEV